jgi:O-antigen/teichoic acid export membrane protein
MIESDVAEPVAPVYPPVTDGEPSDIATRPAASLSSQTLHGLKWSYGAAIVTALLQIVSAAILARLVAPAAYGLVAIAGVVLRFGSYFSQMGIGPAMIQKQDLSNDDIQAGFTSAVMLGLVFFAGIYVLAPLAVLIFNDSDVILVVRWMALDLLFVGLSTTAVSLLQRRLEFRILALADIISFAVSTLAIGIPLAYLGFGVWSLVISSLAQGLILAVFVYWKCRHPVRLSFRWASHKALLMFGSRLSVIRFLEFITTNIDTVLIGHSLGAVPLGLYNRASLLVSVPAQSFSTSLLRVLFPALSRIQTDRSRLEEVYSAGVLFLGVGLCIFALAISASAQEIVLVILGDRWVEVIPTLQIFAIGVPINLLLSFDGVICDATANLGIKLRITIVRLVLFLGLWLVFVSLGLVGFAWAFVLSQVASYTIYTVVVMRIIGLSRRPVLELHSLVVGVGVVVWVSILALTSLLRALGSADWLILVGQISLSIFISIWIVCRPPRRLKLELQRRFKASDLTFLRGGPLRFLLRYCQWLEVNRV